MGRKVYRWIAVLAMTLNCGLVFADGAALEVELLAGAIAVPDGTAIVRDGWLLIADSFAEAHLGYTRQVGDKAVTLKAYGHEWVFREGAKVCSCDGEQVALDAPAALIGEQFYCPARALLEPLGARVRKLEEGSFELELPRAHLLNIRQGSHGDKVRVVLDLSAPVPFEWESASHALGLLIPVLPDPQGRNDLLRQLQFKEALVPTVTENRDKGWSQITINHSSGEAPVVFTLPEPARIVIDFFRPEPIAEPRVLEMPQPQPLPEKIDGVEWRSCNFDTVRGPVQAWLLTVDPTDPDIVIRPALAATTIHHRRTVKSIALRDAAYAAVNGGFFAPRGQPLGMVVIDGEWISNPLYQRAVLGLTKDGKVQVRNVSFDGWVEFEELGRLPLEGMNRAHTGDHGVVLYTSRWGDCLLGNPRKTRVVVSGGVAQSVLSHGEVAPIPQDGFVLSGLDRRAEALLRVEVGQSVSLLLDTKPTWPELWHAVGGGPRLLTSGKIALSYYDERFRADVRAGTRPRTAAGIDKDGRLILLVVDNVNKGMTLGELAKVMSKLGVVDAMNLDGGGSSTLVIAGRHMNQPSDGVPRSVSNAIIIIDRGKSVTSAGAG